MKLEIPQINEKTGLSYDWLNEITNLVVITQMVDLDHGDDKDISDEKLRELKLEELKNEYFGKGEHVKTYEEWFNPEKYVECVNDQNREGVARLNEYAALLNQIPNGKVDVDNLRNIYAQCKAIIEGE